MLSRVYNIIYTYVLPERSRALADINLIRMCMRYNTLLTYIYQHRVYYVRCILVFVLHPPDVCTRRYWMLPYFIYGKNVVVLIVYVVRLHTTYIVTRYYILCAPDGGLSIWLRHMQLRQYASSKCDSGIMRNFRASDTLKSNDILNHLWVRGTIGECTGRAERAPTWLEFFWGPNKIQTNHSKISIYILICSWKSINCIYIIWF
jgi:hypothetical protein